MGGIAFLLAALLALLAGAVFMLAKGMKNEAISITVAGIFSLLNAAIGIIDDLTKLSHRQNAGLRPYQKLILQLITAIAFLLARRILLGDETTLDFAFGQIDLGFVYYPMATSPNFKSFDETLDELLSRKTTLATSTIFPTERVEIKPEEFQGVNQII
jgi:UDP-N-acetylmuramyl pentapeptide phosphotransferase/UDP-N-acetylglucosamine-1-phosphate transferase